MNVSAALAAYNANNSIAPVAVLDLAATVVANLDALQAMASAISSIAFSDASAPSISIPFTQCAADNSVLNLFTGSYALAVSGVPAWAPSVLQADAKVTSFAVSASSATVASNLDALQAATKLGAITLTDSSALAITYAQLTADTTALGLLPSDYTLVVSGVPAAAVATVQANAHVTSFAVSDTGAAAGGAIDAINAATKISAVTLTDSGALPVTYAQLTGDTAALGKLPGSYTLTVSAVTAGNAAATQANSHVTAFSVSDTAAHVAGALDALSGYSKLSAIALTDGGTPVLSVAYTQYTTDTAALAAIGGSYALSVSAVPASAAAAVQGDSRVSSFAVTGVSVASAATIQGDSKVTSFAVADTASAVNAALDTLAGSSKLSAIALTDGGTPVLTLTYTQYANDQAALGGITSAYAMTVSGAPGSAAATLQADTHISAFTVSGVAVSGAAAIQSDSKSTSFTVSDGAAAVSGGMDALAGYSKLSSIALTGASPVLTITYNQLSSDNVALGKVTGSFGLTVTGVSAANAASVQANSKVTGFALSDNAADVAAALDTLQGLSKLTAIALTDSSALSITYTQLTTDTGVLAVLPIGYSLVVGGVPASASATMQANTHVASFSVSDIASAVAGVLDTLAAASKLASIALTDSAALPITYSQLTSDAAALGKLPAGYRLSVSGASATNASLLAANIHVTSFTVADTSANLLANVASFGKASSITLTGTSNTVTAAQYATLTGLTGFVFGAGATLNVADTASGLLTGGSLASAATVSLIGTANTVTGTQFNQIAGLNHFTLGAGSAANISTNETIGPGTPGSLSVASSTFLVAGGLTIGAGGAGSLSLTSGGNVGVTGALTLGQGAGGFGTIDIAGATLSAGGNLNIGAGVGGASVVNLKSGSEIMTGAVVTIGSTQVGDLLIDQGSTVIETGSAVIAAALGSGGSGVRVSGAGSGWQISGSLIVGNADFGELSIAAGASVTASSLDSGILANSAGVITVSGTNAALTTAGSLSVGEAGAGVLSVLNGANVIIGGDFNIGQGVGGSGNVNIQDGTGTVSVGANLNIGMNGAPAVLTVGPTSTLMVDNGGINAGANAVLNLFTAIDPIFLAGGTSNISSSSTNAITQIYTAYVSAATFNIAQGSSGMAYTLETPTILGASKFNLGGSGDTLPVSLILNSGSVSSGTTITFNNAIDTLVIGIDNLATIDTPASGTGPFTAIANPTLNAPLIAGFQGTIAGFVAGDTIDVDTNGTATFTLSGSIVSVIQNGTTTGTLAFATATMAQNALGSVIDVPLSLCFLAGTLIRTPTGEVEVEKLGAGDTVLTASGKVRPIAWIGQGKVLATRGRRTAATPVIVRKGALGPNVPHADLRVTKGHSLFVDDVLVPVEFLVNHRSILWDDRAQEVSIYHVELDAHDVLLANGAPAESYRDDGNRWLFQNANSGWSLPPKEPCAPVLTGGPVVDAVWRRLLDACGPRPGLPQTDDPDLHLLADGVRVDGIRTGDNVSFSLRSVPAELRIVSRSGCPAELGLARDPRELGVAIRRIGLFKGHRAIVVEAEDPRLADGFHDYEAELGHRWTSGDALLPPALFDGIDGRVDVQLTLGGTTRYWDEGGPARRVAA